MEQFRAFLRRKNIVFSAKRYGVDALGAMAQGLFCTLLVGTILNTLGTQFHIGFLSATVVTVGTGEAATAYTIGGLASAMVGPAMAVAIGSALQAPALVLFSLVPVGYATNILGGAGGPLAVLVIAIVVNLIVGRLPGSWTKFDTTDTKMYSVGDQGGYPGDPHCDGFGGDRGGLSGGASHWHRGFLGGEPYYVGHGAAALLHGNFGLGDRGDCPDPAHLQRGNLRGAG